MEKWCSWKLQITNDGAGPENGILGSGLVARCLKGEAKYASINKRQFSDSPLPLLEPHISFSQKRGLRQFFQILALDPVHHTPGLRTSAWQHRAGIA